MKMICEGYAECRIQDKKNWECFHRHPHEVEGAACRVKCEKPQPDGRPLNLSCRPYGLRDLVAKVNGDVR